MKQQNITPIIIELAKAIAEHWRMEIRKGTWYLQESRDNSELFLFYYLGITTANEMERVLNVGKDRNLWKVFPIPDIIDCERKLIELGYESMNLLRRPFKHPWMANVWDAESHDLDADTIKRWEDKGGSLHEIALSITLKALKEGK